MEMLRMSGISKTFFGVPVLDNVDFAVEEGEVHALLGENGAGKSTLMNILAGIYARDGGSISFDGRELKHSTIQSTEHAGIAFVHQELNLFSNLKVYENIFLAKELLTRFGVLNKREMIARTRALFDALGVDIDPTATVSDLEASKQQLLEIAKALHADAKLFILDEPTTTLNSDEVKRLFDTIRGMKARGKSFIFISHKMTEIFDIADRYTVLRNGNMIQSGRIADVTPTEVTRMMIGDGYTDTNTYMPRPLGEEILELENYSGTGFENINLTIRKGEVVGFTGLKGAGISELMLTIFGAMRSTGGTCRINGYPCEGNIRDAMQHKLGLIAANRKENSILPDLTLMENNYVSEHVLTLGSPVILKRRERKRLAKMRDLLNLRYNSENDLITNLSGGNQQKIVLARWLNADAEILLMDNPTQGIDVGAKAEIYKLILQLARQGKTILINTLEIPELQKMADRCVVFYHGHIQAILRHEKITEEAIMLAATNANQATEGASVG